MNEFEGMKVKLNEHNSFDSFHMYEKVNILILKNRIQNQCARL